MRTQVGGKYGFGESTTVTNISWPRNEFYEDEVCTIKLECDNSACAHDVTWYSARLIQTKVIQVGDSQPPTMNEFEICK